MFISSQNMHSEIYNRFYLATIKWYKITSIKYNFYWNLDKKISQKKQKKKFLGVNLVKIYEYEIKKYIV